MEKKIILSGIQPSGIPTLGNYVGALRNWKLLQSDDKFCYYCVANMHALTVRQDPKLLLLDEHTAALDPKTALKVLTLSAKIVEENHLTTMMITHNMKDAIKYGNRLIMMHEGHIIYDVAGEEKKNLHVSDLLAKFQIASGGEFANDRMILS